MKKILLTIFILFSCFSTTFANEDKRPEDEFNVNVVVWMDVSQLTWSSCEAIVQEGLTTGYNCSVPKTMSWILGMLGQIIKYFTFITLLVWVLFLVIWGIMYSMSWIDDELKSNAKKMITKIISWLILLLLSWYILQFLAPWFFK